MNIQQPTNTLYLLLILFSGMAALLYEVLWVHDLGLLFGNTAQATSATLSAFFSGMALGGWFWARQATRIMRPLRVFAGIEIAIALSALVFFGVFHFYQALYPSLGLADATQGMRVLVKLVLSWLILVVPAFCMGGTLPMLAQHLVRTPNMLGRQAASLYSANTLGGVLGVLLAGFYLPPWLGYQVCYGLAVTINLVVALAAWSLDKRASAPLESAKLLAPISRSRQKKMLPAVLPITMLRSFTFLSGLITLALQVLWVRMFAQVLQNSVQTFALILVIFLLSLALSASLVNRILAKTQWSVRRLLFFVFAGSAFLLPLSLLLFNALSHDLAYFGGQENWWFYQLSVLGLLLSVMLPPLLLLGGVLPLLIKLAEMQGIAPGALVGRLMALNTLGAIVGSLLAGFVLLEWLGLWGSLLVISCLLWLSALCLHLALKQVTRAKPWLGLTVAMLSIVGVLLVPLPKMHAWPGKPRVLAYWEGSAASVAVLVNQGERSLVLNNHYILGGTSMMQMDVIQGVLPMVLHPEPKRVFTIGMGTGVTAGATLQFPIEHLAVSELVPEVIHAARQYFSDVSFNLFADPRVSLVEEDGRNYLLATEQQYDVIIGDLFVPWSAGAGALYSLEHFSTLKARLNKGGMFMQWLPSYQIGEQEFGIIVRTLLEAFPCVSLWRGDFVANLSMVGLLAERECQALRPELADIGLAHSELGDDQVPLLAHYVAELSAYKDWFSEYPLNTDNYPVIEFLAPQWQRQRMAKQSLAFNGRPLLNFMQQLNAKPAAIANQHFALQAPEWRSAPQAGLALQQFAVAVAEQDGRAATSALHRYQALIEQLGDSKK